MNKVCLAGLTIVMFGVVGVFENINPNSEVNNTGYVYAKTRHQNFNNKDYVIMSYLKLTKQKASTINKNSVFIDKNGKVFEVTDQSNKYTVKVHKNSVTITDGSNRKHSYSKKNLLRKFKNKKRKLETLVVNNSNSDSVSENSQSIIDANSQQNQQQTSIGQSQEQTVQQDTQQSQEAHQNTDPDISEEEWWSRMLAAGWDERHDTEAEYAQKAGLTN